jgi:hypothetical protein
MTVDDVIGKVAGEATEGRGTKACNVCHESGGAKNGERLSKPILRDQVFKNADDENVDLAPFIISSEEPGQKVNPGIDPTDPNKQRKLEQQSLTQICDCIRTALEDGPARDPWRRQRRAGPHRARALREARRVSQDPRLLLDGEVQRRGSAAVRTRVQPPRQAL